jgi:hypothetical protein
MYPLVSLLQYFKNPSLFIFLDRNEGITLEDLGLLELCRSENLNFFVIIDRYCIIYLILSIYKRGFLFMVHMTGMISVRIGYNRVMSFR